MATVSTYVDVDVELEDFSDKDLLEEVRRRGIVNTVGSVADPYDELIKHYPIRVARFVAAALHGTLSLADEQAFDAWLKQAGWM